jgi:hypothetical protein
MAILNILGTSIWYILWQFGIYYDHWYTFLVLVCCNKKNLAPLVLNTTVIQHLFNLFLNFWSFLFFSGGNRYPHPETEGQKPDAEESLVWTHSGADQIVHRVQVKEDGLQLVSFSGPRSVSNLLFTCLCIK